MATKSQNIRIGVFAAVAGTLLVIVLVAFAGLQLWEHRDRYRIVFDHSVYGLEDGAHVFLNGVRVGVVDEIAVARHDIDKVEVTIAIDEDTPVHTDTVAVLQYAGITGLKVVDLRDGTSAAPRLPPGGTIAQGETLLDKLEASAEILADQSTALMIKANRVVDNLIAITDARQFDGIADIVAQTRAAAGNLRTASASLEQLVAENRGTLRASIASIDKVARSASALLDDQVSRLVGNAGDVVTQLEDLVSDNQGTLRAAVFDLRQASRTFKDLARELRQRPSRLLYSPPVPERELP